MTKGVIPFYATTSDLSALLKAVRIRRDVKFVRAGLLDSPEQACSDEPDEVRPFGLYLVIDRDRDVAIRPVPQRKGGVKYAVDESQNPEGASLHPGGLLDGRRLLSG